MVNPIINSFSVVNDYYEKLIDISEKKFTALKVNDLDNLKLLNKNEMVCIYDLQDALVKLKRVIVSACEEKNTEEKRLNALIPYMTMEEKEKVMACQKTAFTYERKLKNNLKMNKCLAEALVESTETVIEAWTHIARQENPNGNVFINKEI